VPSKADELSTLAVEVLAAPKVEIAAEQALLVWQTLQSRPLKPDVHCPLPEQPEEVAVFCSSVRFEVLATGFPQVIVEQLLPLHANEATRKVQMGSWEFTHMILCTHPKPVGHSHCPLADRLP
jgi:hypothetical protein